MFLGRVLVYPGKAQAFEEPDADFVIHPNRAVSQGSVNQLERAFSDEPADSFVPPLRMNDKVLDFAEGEADPIYSNGADNELAVGFYDVVNPAFHHVGAPPFEGEAVVDVDKASNLFRYFIVW